MGRWPKPTPSHTTKATFNQLREWIERVEAGEWSWCADSPCKYVEIRIDTRSGAYSIADRDGNAISFEQLAHQYGREVP